MSQAITPTKTSSKKIREAAKQLNPIDDPLFEKMAESKPFCQEILRTFLEEPDLIVLTNTPQKSYENLQGRSIRVDLVCDIDSGQVVNVEVEKNSLNHWNRVIYNFSIITTNTTDPGTEFDDIPKVIVVYITRKDFLKLGRTKYIVEYYVNDYGPLPGVFPSKIFINATVDDGSPIAQLMKIFTEDDAYDEERFPETSYLKKHYKKQKKWLELCLILSEIFLVKILEI